MIQPKGQAALGFIFVTLLIDVMGFGIIIPVLPKLIEHLIHGNISPVIGGILGKYNVQYPLLAAVGLAFLNVIYVYFILPESLSKENRRPLDWKRCSPWGSLLQLSKYKAVFGLAVSLFLVYFAAQAVQSVWTFYTIKKFNWNEAVIGYSLGVVGLLVAILQ